MHAFLIYSKDGLAPKTITEFKKVVFVKRGVNWLYMIDIINFFHAIAKRFYLFALIIGAITVLNCLIATRSFQWYLISSSIIPLIYGFCAYNIEIFFLNRKNFKLTQVINAKNEEEARLEYLRSINNLSSTQTKEAKKWKIF